jgi:hypothetical protein
MLPAHRASNSALRAPRLLVLVLGIFLVLVGITGSALVAITSSHLLGATLDAVVERDRSLVDLFANGNLRLDDLDAAPDHRRREIGAQLDALRRKEPSVDI